MDYQLDLYLIVVRAHVYILRYATGVFSQDGCSRFCCCCFFSPPVVCICLCIGNNMGVMSELNCSFCVCACAGQMIMVVLSRVQYFGDLEVVAVYLLFLFCLLLVW